MPSIAQYTYPQMVWRDGEKKLWNPIHRKALINRPEERVRLRIMESLIRAGWSKHRISTEEAIGQLGDTSMRTDIICYTQQFDPRILIECKSEYISISAKTAEQVARYNRNVGAPYLLMTNGVTDYWYGIEDGSQKIKELEGIPDLFDAPEPDYSFDDWKKRGFTGKKASPSLRMWLKQVLPNLFLKDGDAGIRFLSFSDGPSDLELSHYYRIANICPEKRLAVTILNTAYGGNRLVIILNESDENKAVMEVNLDLLFEEKKSNGSIYSAEGIETFDLADFFDLSSTLNLNKIVEQVGDWFSKHVG